MNYRITKNDLFNTLTGWDGFLKRKIHLIACGGTTLTLTGIKASTKDIDFMVPDETEYRYLIKILGQLGYQQKTGSGWTRNGEPYIFDLFQGKRIHTTELLESPLREGNHVFMKEWQYIYLGTLNDYDLIISKLFRGSSVDFEDCLSLLRARHKEIEMVRLRERFIETAGYDVSQDRVIKNWEHFEKFVNEENLYG